MWDGVSCTGSVYLSKIWLVILSSVTALNPGRIRSWKKVFNLFFLLTCAVQFVLPFLDSGFSHFILSNMHVIGSLGIKALWLVNQGCYELRTRVEGFTGSVCTFHCRAGLRNRFSMNNLTVSACFSVLWLQWMKHVTLAFTEDDWGKHEIKKKKSPLYLVIEIISFPDAFPFRKNNNENVPGRN